MYSIANSTTYEAQDYIFTRDDQGRAVNVMVKYTVVSYGVSERFNPDMVNEINYKTGSNQASFLYQYPVGKTAASGDSLVLSYTGENITDSRIYDLSGATPKDQFTETTWAYDNAGHLTSSIAPSQDPNQPIYYTYVFDGKVDPLKLGVEAILADPKKMSAGNILSINTDWPAGVVYASETYQYTYRSDDRPLRATYTQAFLPNTKVINYYYSR